MWKKLTDFFFRFKKILPENKLKSEYIEMIQKLKKLENQVETNAKQLELAKASFLKNLYHEIRTPLNAIMGFTNLIAKEGQVGPDEREEYLALINQSSSEFLRIMDDIIQAAILEAGMIKLNKDEFALNDFFQDIHTYFNMRKHILEKNNIALLMNIPEQLDELKIVCDKQRLNQVLSQLLENALKFTDRGTIEFGYTIKEDKLEVFVKDSGIGNLEGKDKYLFSRFSKLDISDDSKNGLGLGLSISKMLLELMGGKIWYTPNNSKGTTFYFDLPVIASENKNIAKGEKAGFLEGVFKQKSLAV
jgi:signal transduction histidine kinase